MPYSNHWLLQFNGIFDQENLGELWSFGIRGVPGVGRAFGDEDAVLGDIQAGLAAWFSGASSWMRNDAVLKNIKLNEIGPDGKYVDPTTHEHDYTTTVRGAGPRMWPTFVTCAWSWTTAKARGQAHTGRIYPPCTPTGATGAATKLGTTDQNAFRDSAKALLSSISSVSGTFDIAPRVASKVGGQLEPITGVRIGNVIDVQRRRKNGFVETYVSSAWP